MVITTNSWKKLFLLCLGMVLAASFCMKWLEDDFKSGNSTFTILGLELFYSRQKFTDVLAGLDEHVKTILRYHLSFDFVFMAGVYPGIACVCVMAIEKTKSVKWKRVLFVLAMAQLLAWAADCLENSYLFNHIKYPPVGNGFETYHVVVAFKWIVALSAVIISVPLALKRTKKLY